MKTIAKITAACCIIGSTAFAQQRDRVERIPFVENILSQMTLEEKVGQMTQLTMDVITEGDNIFSSHEPAKLSDSMLQDILVKHKVGSILNTANNRARTTKQWNEWLTNIQDVAMNQTRLGIPVIYGIDAIHGATYTADATLIPQQIGQGATFNRELVRQGAAITAYEVKASGITWNFSPVLGVGVDPRWPRQWETFGEDPYLVSELGVEMIHGMEGDDIGAKENLASCSKHFLGYTKPESGKDRTPASISDIDLRERFLPPFQAAIAAGSQTVMINSSMINSIPVHANYDLLTIMLKQELGFDGIVVTDWADIQNLYQRERMASSDKEAVRLAINAGIDMAMVPYDIAFIPNLIELVQEGEVSMKRIDDAVRRVLNIKYKSKLWETPVPNYKDYGKFASKEFEQASYNTAAESITLLKNEDNILPLANGTKILVTGPNANSMRTLNGGWSYSWQGEKVEDFAGKYNTIVEAVQSRFGKKNVSYVSGVEYLMDGKYWQDTIINIDAVLAAAQDVDVVLVAIGENSYTEKPGDLHDLYLSDNQQELVTRVAQSGKKVILVLNEGRPRVISKIEPLAAAVLQTYVPANFGGDALADILIGDVNPSGKLPYTYPRFPNSLVVYNHKYCEESLSQSGVYDYGGGFLPQYEFGHGLSYTTFEYSDLTVSQNKFYSNDVVELTVTVTNTGDMAGKETVMLFSSDRYASIPPDVKRLRRFSKIDLAAGESQTVTFKLTAEDLSFINAKMKRVAEKGFFDLKVANQSVELYLNNTAVFE